jgi:hypothetical protein
LTMVCFATNVIMRATSQSEWECYKKWAVWFHQTWGWEHTLIEYEIK